MATDLTARITGLAAQIEERLTEDHAAAKAIEHSLVVGADPLTEAFTRRFDAARMLRRIAVTRELVAEILDMDHFLNDIEWQGCEAVTGRLGAPDVPSGRDCTCGRDERVARLLGIIASEWET